MSGRTILVVEDEALVAEDIRETLAASGYHVPMIAATGDEAIARTAELRPDLVLMDIRIRGPRDGIDAANEIYERFEIPVVYLTAYADDATLRRARASHPFGYLLKPFDEKQLQTNIEIALDRHRIESDLRGNERCFAKALQCSGLAMIATDCQGQIVAFNEEAERLTGWNRSEAVGMDIGDVFEAGSVADLVRDTPRILNGGPPNPVREAELLSPATDEDFLITRGGRRVEIQLDAGVVRDRQDRVAGIVVSFREVGDDDDF